MPPTQSRPSSPRRSPPSPRPSATPPAARSTSSPTSSDDAASPPPRWPSSFELHPNVARHHLDKLAGGGYLEVAIDRGAGGGAGRPSKRYRASAPTVEPRAARSATTTCSSRCSAGRSPCCRPTQAEAHGRGGRRRVRPGHGRRRWATPATPSARSAPRCTPSPTRSPPTASPPTPRSAGQRAAHRVRALPVRRRRHRAPGDLRRRPRHGQGHARRALRRDRPRTSTSSLPMGDDAASPPSTTEPIAT